MAEQFQEVEPDGGDTPDAQENARRALNARKTRFLLAAAVSLLTLGVLLFMFSPFFHVSEIHIFGNSRISDAEILARLEIGDSAHLLLYNTRAAAARIRENLYIEEVTFERIMPGRLHVYVSERRLTAYFEHSPGSFLFLDDNGRVLEVRTYFTEPLPVLEGLRFTRFQLGEILEVPDPTAFGEIVQYAQLLYQHGLIDRVSHINVVDTANIRIRIGAAEFNVGTAADADHKVRFIVQVMEEKPGAGLIPGFMDLRETRSHQVFEVLQ